MAKATAPKSKTLSPEFSAPTMKPMGMMGPRMMSRPKRLGRAPTPRTRAPQPLKKPPAFR